MNLTVKENVNQYIYGDILNIIERELPWENLSKKTILITGANGFIGQYLVLSLLAYNDLYNADITVYGLVRNEKKSEKVFGKLLTRDDFKLTVQDICSPIQSEPADFIIHAASQASAYHFENDPVGTMNANLIGTSEILKYAVKSNSDSVLFISSLKVYGNVHDGSECLKEENTGYINHVSYKSCYAQGKRAAETLCASFYKQYGVNVKITRPSYIYGASTLDDDRVWAQFLKNVVKNENIVLKSNGSAYRSFCYVSDTVSALYTILLTGKNNYPYNIASANSNTTIRDFALTAVKAFPERNLCLSFANKEDEIMPERSLFESTPEILDYSRLKALGWEAKVNLTEGIKKSVDILEYNEING